MLSIVVFHSSEYPVSSSDTRIPNMGMSQLGMFNDKPCTNLYFCLQEVLSEED